MRGMYDKWLLVDLDGDGDLDAAGTRGNSEPYDGVLWLEQVRSSEPGAVFTQARSSDSEQTCPHEPPLKWKAAKSVPGEEGGPPQLRVSLRGPRRLSDNFLR